MTTMASIKKYINQNEKLMKTIYRLAMKIMVKPYVALLHVPVIAVTGTNGKTTVTRLLNRIYIDAGYNVGICTTEGVMHNGVTVSVGDESGGGGVWKAAKCPDVDLLVLETARKGILDYGLGFYKCRVGIVTNVYEDHLGFDGINTIEDMAEVKSMIPKNTDSKGFVVLNGDDSLVMPMADISDATPIYFVMDNDYRMFERVFFLKGKMICKKNGETVQALINVEDIPITLNGFSRHNIANVMAALAAIEGLNELVTLRFSEVKNTLIKIDRDSYDNIGRSCLLNFNNEAVFLSKCKNPESYSREVEIIERIKKDGGFDKIVGVLTAVGNRRDTYYQDISRIVSHVCDMFFIRPPKHEYLRGRSESEIVRLLSAYIPKDKILSDKKASLSVVMDESKDYFMDSKSKILFVVFNNTLDADIDMMKIVKSNTFINRNL